MKLFKARAAMAVAVFALSLGACSGGGGMSPNTNTGALPQPNVGAGAGFSTVFTLSPGGGTHSLPLPAGYSGAISLGANHAPRGTEVRLDVSGNGMTSGGAAPLSTTTTTDPFPIIIGIRVRSTVTQPVPGFSITFPRTIPLQGTFDVSFYDPTKPAAAQTNPALLGVAVISGQTLTFTPQPNATVTLLAGVQYTFIISRDVSSSSTNAVVLPVQSGTTQTLASVGPLGALTNYQASSNTGFLTWETISGSPALVPQFILGDNPIESIVVSSSQTLTLTNTVITGVFATNTQAPASASRRLSNASAARAPFATATATPAPGTFVPDPTPTVLGPFPATVTGNQTSFTVPDGLALGGKRAWDFSVVTVTACTPLVGTAVCNDGTATNLKTSVSTNSQFDVLVSDSSGLLTGSYDIAVTAPCTTAGIIQDDSGDTSDTPPGYHDSPQGPNAEFEVHTTAIPGTCTINATYNGVQVAQTTIAVNAPGSSTFAVPFTLRPPVNGPSGLALSGTTH